MQSIVIAMAGVLFVLAVEGLLFWMFCRKSCGLLFPREADLSSFPFFNPNLMWLYTILHTLVLSVSTAVILIALW